MLTLKYFEVRAQLSNLGKIMIGLINHKGGKSGRQSQLHLSSALLYTLAKSHKQTLQKYL